MNRTHLNVMVVRLMNLQGIFGGLDTFLLGWLVLQEFLHSHTPQYCYANCPGRPLALEVEMCPFLPGASLSRGGEVRGALADHVLLCFKCGMGQF